MIALCEIVIVDTYLYPNNIIPNVNRLRQDREGTDGSVGSVLGASVP